MVKNMCNYCGIGSDVLAQISFTTYSYLISYTVNVRVSQWYVCTCMYMCVYMHI